LTKQNGNSHHTYRYDPYGAVLPENGNFTDPHNHYTLTGKEFDENTGLVWFGARHYDPETGVWMGQDTYRGRLNDPASLHRFVYVGDNPVSYWDWYGFLFKDKGQERHDYITAMAFDRLFNEIETEVWEEDNKKKAKVTNNNSINFIVANAKNSLDKKCNKDEYGYMHMHRDYAEEHGYFRTRIDSSRYSIEMLEKAKSAIDTGNAKEAFEFLTLGLHAIQDRYFNNYKKNSLSYNALYGFNTNQAIYESMLYIRMFNQHVKFFHCKNIYEMDILNYDNFNYSLCNSVTF
uniref:RHS repeat domain-containing protein n=1 Tax=Candidatus Electrothrix sp. TaxID=2170559 RepID=UPI004055A387